MKLRDLITYLREHDVQLALNGTTLSYDAPTSSITDALLAELRRRKSQLRVWVANRDHSARRTVRAPLSFAQERMWQRHHASTDPAIYNVVQRITLIGQLDPQALRYALNALVARHDSLRTQIMRQGDSFFQEVLPTITIELPITDSRALPEENKLQQAESWCQTEARRVFALDQAPLIRAALLRLTDEHWIFLLNVHHFVFDGWSLAVALRELAMFYTEGGQAKVEPLPLQYIDYARWQRRYLENGRREELLRYWLAQLDGAPLTLALPYDRPRTAQVSSRGGSHLARLFTHQVRALEQVAYQSRTTLYTVLFSAFALMLSRLCKQTDLVIASPSANRIRREHEPIIGLFVNNVALRVQFDAVTTFNALIQQVSHTFFMALDHQEIPFGQLVDALHASRGGQKTPFPQVAFVLQNMSATELPLPGLTGRVEDLLIGAAKYDLILVLEPDAQGINALFDYRSDLFDAATGTQWALDYVHLLDQVIHDANLPLDEYTLANPLRSTI